MKKQISKSKKSRDGASSASRSYRAVSWLYDDEYAELHAGNEDVAMLIADLGVKSRRVLLAGCGTGRAAIPLAEAGHRVLGLDYDESMLAIAREKSKPLGLDADRLSFRCVDLLKWKVGAKDRGRFDCAASLFNSFLVFTTTQEQLGVLARLRDSLRSGGSVVIDVFNPSVAELSEEAKEQIEPHLFFSHHLGRSVMRVVSVRPGRGGQRREVRFDYHWHDDDGESQHRVVKFEITWFERRELELLLNGAGFRVREVRGGYNGKAYSNDSPRLIVRADKR
jgi:SAM-dependent methyltransferase